MIIDNIIQKELDGSLYLEIFIKTDNVDNYTANKIKDILESNFNHYNRSGQIVYGQTYYHTYSDDNNIQNNNNLLFIDKCTYGELYDYDSEESDDVEKKDQYKNIFVFSTFNKSDVNDNINVHKRTNFLFLIIKNITIDNEEYWNTHGTQIVNFKKNCTNHQCVYYSYIYGTNLKYDLLSYDCHTESNLNSVIADINGFMNYHGIFRGKYFYITDKNHNVLYESSNENKNC
jgi:hypothetical protein